MNPKPTPTPALVSVRAQTDQLVTSVAVQNGEASEAVYSRIYTRLQLLYGVDVYTLPHNDSEPLLTVAERFGWLDTVYSIAYAEHLYCQSYEE